MKLTKSRLKQIISEELGRIEEVDNNRVEIQTAQSMTDDLNQTGDPKLIEEVSVLLDQIVTVVAYLSDGSLGAAIINQVESLKGIIDETRVEKEARDRDGRAEVNMPDQNMGGVKVNTPGT